LVFYRTICAFTKYVKSSHTNKHVGSVHLCLYCSYKNLVGIMFTDKHKNSGIPKKLHRTPQRSTARLCVKLIGRKNWKMQHCRVCSIKTCSIVEVHFHSFVSLVLNGDGQLHALATLSKKNWRGRCVLSTPWRHKGGGEK